MKIFCTASSDTYITNKIIDGSTRATDANVGRAGVLDLFKLYGESSLPADEKTVNLAGDYNLDTDDDGTPDTAIELSRVLVKFNLGKIQELTGSKIDLTSSNFSAKIKLFDVKTGHAVPSNFTVMAIPLSKSFDEGVGRDLSSFNDLDVTNWLTSSYSSPTTNVWNTAGADASGSQGTDNVDLVETANFSDGSGVRSLVYTQLFTKGTEDLSLDVTPFVSASVAGLIPNHGFRISLTGSEEKDDKTRFIKRFASRHVSNPLLRPRLEVSFDDTITDNSRDFYFDTSGSIFLNSYDRAGSANLLSGTAGILGDVTGHNCLRMNLEKGNFSLSVIGSQFTQGSKNNAEPTRFLTGVYSASFALQSQDSNTVYKDDGKGNVITLAKLIAKEGSVTFDQYWVSLDQTFAFHTGSLTIFRADRRGSNFVTNDPMINATNLQLEYTLEDEVKVRVFGRDLKKEKEAPVKVPYSRKSEIFNEIYYRVKDVDSGKSIINFGETDNSTRLSTDSDGMFFDFHMDILPPGRTYFFEYLIIDRNVRKIVKDKNAAFRVK